MATGASMDMKSNSAESFGAALADVSERCEQCDSGPAHLAGRESCASPASAPCPTSGARAQRSRSWSKAQLLEIGAAHDAPAAPGIILLIPNVKSPERTFWAGATPNIGERLDEMLRIPQDDARLEAMLAPYPRDVSFRYLVVPDRARRRRLLTALATKSRFAAMAMGGSTPARAEAAARSRGSSDKARALV